MSALKVGSLFSGYGGLDLAVCEVFGANMAWHAETEPGPAAILAAHWPDVPNLGDITAVDWSQVEPIDVLTGGFPCQDISAAGRQAGMGTGTRSGLWSHMCEAISILRPRYVVIENVRALLSTKANRNEGTGPLESAADAVGDRSDGPTLRALGAVLGDLADIGYDARWTTLRASAVGTPHHRARVFLLATPSDAESGRRDHGAPANVWATDREVDTPGDDRDIAAVRSSAVPADPDGVGWGEGPQQPVAGTQEVAATVGDLGALPRDRRTDDVLVLPTPRTTDSHGPGHHGQGGPDLRTAISYLPTPNAADGNGGRYNATGHQSSLPGTAREVGNWGKYAPAIHRWESLTRPAPAPTEPNRNGKPRLNAAFVEWMMGLPAGWVTDPAIGISRADQLKAIGNGVCPPQAVAALRSLLDWRVSA